VANARRFKDEGTLGVIRHELNGENEDAEPTADLLLDRLGRRGLWQAGLALTLAGITTPVAAASKSRASKAMETTQLACDAFKKSDIDTIKRLLRPDFTQINTTGTVQHLPEILDEVRIGKTVYEEFRNHSMSAKFVNGVAIVVGITSLRGQSSNRTFQVDVRFTDILEDSAGYWRLVTSHVTKLPDR
jgi:hypothetical protein